MTDKVRNDGVPSIVFLDRDGTINEDYGYVTQPSRVTLIPGAARAIGDLRRAGFLVVIVSNQSAVGRGMAQLEDVEATNRELQRLLCEEDADACPDQSLFAPDHPDSAGEDRKPGIGMLKKVKEFRRVDPSRCWVVGDKVSDLGFGQNAGFPKQQCLLVLTGQGRSELQKLPPAAQAEQPVFESLTEAAEHIVSHTAALSSTE